MGRVLFISTATLKKNTPIQQNVDDDLLNPYIYKAQETHIQQILGTNLYDKIMTLIQTNTMSQPSNINYKLLLDDYIIPCLTEYSFYEVMPFISLKITNKSIVRGNAEFATEGDLTDLKYLRSTVRDIAEFYAQRVSNYLKQYSYNFPEYFTNSGLDKIVPNSTSYFSGVYIGGTGRYSDCKWGLGDRWRDIY
jgi:hypothetical protein